MRIQLLEQVEPVIDRLLGTAHEVFIATGYVGGPVMNRFLQRCRRLRGSGLGSVMVLCGIDLHTDATALDQLHQAALDEPDLFQARFVPHRGGKLFHPKAYWFRSGADVHLIIGSGNFTDGGLSRNHELYLHVECPASSVLARSFSRLRAGWELEPFSQPLTGNLVDLVQQRAKHLGEWLKQQRKQADLQALLTEEERLWAVITQHTTAHVPQAPASASDFEQRLRARIEAGFLFTIRISLAALHVPVTEELLAAAEVESPQDERQTVLVDTSVAAFVRLLPAEALAEFEKLRRDAERELERFSLPLRAGAFVPEPAQPAFFKTVPLLIRRYRELLTRYVRRTQPMREHLQHFNAELEEAWATINPREEPLLPATRQQVWEKVELRRKQLRDEPDAALRFEVASALHPVVARFDHPEHPAWKLEGDSAEADLVQTVLDLLVAQMDQIMGVTRWQQLPARKRDYDRVLRLISVRGKTTRRLLRRLAAWTRPAPKNPTPEERSRRAERLQAQMVLVRREALEHQRWLGELRTKPRSEALELLATEYELPT